MGRAQGGQEGQGRAWRRAQGANAKGEGRKRAQKGPEEGGSRPSEHHVTSVCLIIAAVIGFFSCYHCFCLAAVSVFLRCCIGFCGPQGQKPRDRQSRDPMA